MKEVTSNFVVDAEKMLYEGDIGEAIELCRRGIELYEGFSSAYGILALALIKSGDNLSALNVINEGLKKFPENLFLKEIKNKKELQEVLLSEINQIIDDVEIISEDEKNIEILRDNILFFDWNVLSKSFDDLIINTDEKKEFIKLSLKDIGLIPGLIGYDLIASSKRQRKINYTTTIINFPEFKKFESKEKIEIENFRSKLIELKSQLNYIDNSESKKENIQSGNLMASETLAAIYERQGAKSAAIEQYQLLIENNPEQAENYQKKIDLLKKSQ